MVCEAAHLPSNKIQIVYNISESSNIKLHFNFITPSFIWFDYYHKILRFLYTYVKTNLIPHQYMNYINIKILKYCMNIQNIYVYLSYKIKEKIL
jgi:hypothetical protein